MRRMVLARRNIRLGRSRHKVESTSGDWKLSREALSRENQDRPREPRESSTPSRMQLPNKSHTSDWFAQGTSSWWVRIIQKVATIWDGTSAQPWITEFILRK